MLGIFHAITDSNSMMIELLGPFASNDIFLLPPMSMTDQERIHLRFYAPCVDILADYDLNDAVDIADLSMFIEAWSNEDFSRELGPAIGSVPHLVPALDNSFDLRDIMAFTRMWHWSHQTGASKTLDYDPTGPEIEFVQNGNLLTLDLPEEAIASNLEILYTDGSQTVSVPLVQNPTEVVQLVHHEEENGRIVLDNAFFRGSSGKSITIEINNEERGDFNLEVSYQVYGKGSHMVLSGQKIVDMVAVPEEFALHQNYPNPFNPVTQIDYDLPKEGLARMVIYDVMGREVKELVNQSLNAGYHTVRWDGTNSRGANVSAGLYFCSLSTGSFNKTMKLLLLK